MIDLDVKELLPTEDQVADFLDSCGMDEEEVDDMMRVWDYLGDGPASSKYHHVYENGLRMHVWEMLGLAHEWYPIHEELFQQDLPFTLASLARVIVCHDLHKVGQYTMKYKKCTAKDLEPHLDGKGGVVKKKAQAVGFKYIDGAWKKPSEAIQKYDSKQPDYYLGQGESLYRAVDELGLNLTKEEQQAIYCHMLGFDYGNRQISLIWPMGYFLAALDLISACVYEPVRLQEEKYDLEQKEED